MVKLKFLFIVFFFLYIGIIAKLFYIQIISPQKYISDSYLKTNKITAERGKIFDRNKKPLAFNQNSYLLYIEPKKIDDKTELIKKLDSVLKVGEATIESKIDNSKYWISLFSGIEEDKKKSIEKLKLKGVGFEYGMKRFYPEASLAAHILGFVGKNDKSEDIGYFGLEGFYDKDLRGLPGILESERDLLGRPILIGMQERINPENGRDLILTIDKTVQEISKRKLLEGMERYKAKQGCVITADPYTLQILGMVCLPDFDVENYYKFGEDFFRNPAISDTYEPGSIFKPLIVSAALYNKKIKPDDYYNENGPVKIGDYQIQTWNNKYEGKISITRILEKSSNVGMVYVGEKLGNELTYQAVRNYGFGELTNIDLQGEVAGVLRPKINWYPIDYATVTFGQGIAVTSIQMIRAFSSVINGGKLLRPYLVYKFISQDEEQEIKPKIDRIVSDEKTSEIIKKMLVSTVENGEYKWARPKGYTIGGKTGTAQIPIQGHYDPSKTVASFIGFAPAEHPKFITLVILREPEASQWGSETAAPLFFEITKELLVYYNIAPDQ
jgi:cell division protein FtsI/penicillin-binding protein 2